MRCRLPALALLTLFAGCAEPPVLRSVQLLRLDQVPTAESVLLGNRLRLVVRQLEPVRIGALFAWGRSNQGWRPLGPLEPGETSTFTVADPAGIEEVFVTREAAGLATSPSVEVIFRGRPGELLALGGIGGPSRESLAHTQVHAQLENQRLTLHSTDLPFVGAGLHYAVWMRSQDPQPLRVGKLGSSGMDEFETGELLAAWDEVILTLELDAGDEAAGTVLMKGFTLSETAAVKPRAAAHEH
ncbi:MAG: hypothetical protein H6Q89_1822 [Myxococcaceae bacterium]|nr:hypothetical protein [Myxococcaceae bacterium]